MRTMTVEFDMNEWDDEASEQRALDMGLTFARAFMCSVGVSTTNNWAIYTLTITEEPERCEAIQEMLEWLTTANVRIELTRR
jgi:hypothetical protein